MNRSTSLLLATVGLNAVLLGVLYLVLSDALRDHGLPFFGLGLLGTAVLAGIVFWIGAPSSDTGEPERKASPSPAPPEPDSPDAAVHLLAILQRKGRLVDFLNEDIQQFEDAQIGAAVRTVHEGCKAALDEIIDLEPVMDDAEGSTVTLDAGFDAQAIRLTGNVEGDPPFTGSLRHRGWRVARIDLPERMTKSDDVVAAAEVDIS